MLFPRGYLTRRRNLLNMMFNDEQATKVRAVTQFLTSLEQGELVNNPFDFKWDHRRKRQTRTSSEFRITEAHENDCPFPKPGPYISSDYSPQSAYLGLHLRRTKYIYDGGEEYLSYWVGILFLSVTRLNSEEHTMLMNKTQVLIL